jgi:hypothetical protein
MGMRSRGCKSIARDIAMKLPQFSHALESYERVRTLTGQGTGDKTVER